MVHYILICFTAISDSESVSDDEWAGFTPRKGDPGTSGLSELSRSVTSNICALLGIEVYRYLLGGMF
jgi:hypothetical protein